jgi:hypothetical protein
MEVSDDRQWRTARFRNTDQRAEFIKHARSMGIDGIEVEPLPDEIGIRFTAPAQVAVGLAGMIGAHGGKVMPARHHEPVAVGAGR